MDSSPLRTGLAFSLALGVLALAPPDVFARGSGGRSGGYSSRSYSPRYTYRSPVASSRGSTKCLTCERDASGRIKRDRSAVD